VVKIAILKNNMLKVVVIKPVLIYMYGIPGSGKSFMARQIAEDLGIAHISSDRIRFELFDEPKYDKTEQQIVTHLMDYMAEQFLKAGTSVIYDISVNRLADRRALRDLARACKAEDLGIWIQVDIDTAWQRNNNRDKRKSDDKYSVVLTQPIFEQFVKSMQNPQNENFLVVSGKHLYNSQKATLKRKLTSMGVIREVEHRVAKPELVNLVTRANMQINRPDVNGRSAIIR
jgi:predicted kinase